MRWIPKITPCDVVMPSLEDVLRELVRDNLLRVIILLVLLLLVAAIVTMVVVARRKSTDAKSNDQNADAEENNLWPKS